jgi:Cu+-exporting ATPase
MTMTESMTDPTPETVRDPVCGMTFPQEKAAGTTTHDGETVYFCSAGCKAKFEADPERFSDSSGTSEKGSCCSVSEVSGTSPELSGTSGGKGPWVCPMCPEVEEKKQVPCPSCGMALEPKNVPVRSK